MPTPIPAQPDAELDRLDEVDLDLIPARWREALLSTRSYIAQLERWGDSLSDRLKELQQEVDDE